LIQDRRDKMSRDADWRDGIDAFRNDVTNKLQSIEEKLAMISERISWLEEPPKAPHDKKEEELKL
jgi:hypothetical protein